MAKEFSQPKFKVGQKVKFLTDPDGAAGFVQSLSWDSEKGFQYTIASKYYDPQQEDMNVGVKICLEDELIDMSKEK